MDSNKSLDGLWILHLELCLHATDTGQVDDNLSTEQTSDEVNWILWSSRTPRSINIPHYYDILCICIKWIHLDLFADINQDSNPAVWLTFPMSRLQKTYCITIKPKDGTSNTCHAQFGVPNDLWTNPVSFSFLDLDLKDL
jgi:hypothetical protein